MYSQFDQIINDGVKNGVTPGAVATVFNRDGVLWQGAAGKRVLGGGVDMTVDTVGAIFSMTKAITCVAVMQSIEHGLLSLETPAGDICPELKNPQVLEGFDSANQPILRTARTPLTIKHLLTHTSGLTYEAWSAEETKWKAVTGAKSLATRELIALQTPLIFEPGSRWQYGKSIEWVGKIVEVVSGQTLGNYFAEHITGPLGMDDTAFEHTESMAQRAAGMHARDDDGVLKSIELPKPENPEFELGGGGLHGTMTDYTRFLRMILNNGTLDDVQILKAESVDAMCENHIGSLRVNQLPSVAPEVSNDVEFFPGLPKSWSLAFQISESECHTGRPAGTLMWAGRANSYFWIDRKNGIGGVYLSQLLPFADEQSLDLFYALEKAVYDSIG